MTSCARSTLEQRWTMRTSITLATLMVCSVGWAQDRPPIPQAPVDVPAGRMTLQSETCVVSLPPATEPPPSQETGECWAWVGSPKLAAHVPANGVWTGMGPKHNYRDKWWWWREGYRAAKETEPELTILANRLDGHAPPVVI